MIGAWDVRILQIINSLDTGGAENLVLQLHNRYLNEGHHSRVLVLAGTGAAREGVHYIRRGSPYNVLLPRQLERLPKEYDPAQFQILHAHLFPCQFWMSRWGRRLSPESAMVTTEHSTSNRRRKRPFMKHLDRSFYRRYSAIVCVSEGAAAAFRRWMPEVADRVEMIHNGIDLGMFPFRDGSEKSRGTTVLSVGRLTEAKNYFRALESFSILSRQMGDTNLRYLIAGEGGLADGLRKTARDLGIGDSVEFLGNVEDVSALMREADVFFMPSTREGFGLAAVEAMASGAPVVASSSPGIAEVIGDDGSCGILVDPASPDDMARGLAQVISGNELAEELSISGRKRSESFSIDHTAENYLKLYEGLLRSRVQG